MPEEDDGGDVEEYQGRRAECAGGEAQEVIYARARLRPDHEPEDEGVEAEPEGQREQGEPPQAGEAGLDGVEKAETADAEAEQEHGEDVAGAADIAGQAAGYLLQAVLGRGPVAAFGIDGSGAVADVPGEGPELAVTVADGLHRRRRGVPEQSEEKGGKGGQQERAGRAAAEEGEEDAEQGIEGEDVAAPDKNGVNEADKEKQEKAAQVEGEETTAASGDALHLDGHTPAEEEGEKGVEFGDDEELDEGGDGAVDGTQVGAGKQGVAGKAGDVDEEDAENGEAAQDVYEDEALFCGGGGEAFGCGHGLGSGINWYARLWFAGASPGSVRCGPGTSGRRQFPGCHGRPEDRRVREW